MDTVLFTENQRFNQWWLWLLLIVGLVFELITGTKSLTNPLVFKDILLGIGLPILMFGLVITLLLTLKLKTIVTADYIEVSFGPFKSKSPNRYYLRNLNEVYVRQYKPIQEYGGWGIRYSRNGKAYNIRGNWGLQLVVDSGQKILIGTQQPQQLEAIMQALKLQ